MFLELSQKSDEVLDVRKYGVLLQDSLRDCVRRSRSRISNEWTVPVRSERKNGNGTKVVQ